jgi:hypothetical protein
MFLASLFSIVSIVCALANATHGKCSKRLELNNTAVCDGFKSWSDLKQLVNSTNKTSLAANNSYITLHPAAAIVLTNELDVIALIDAFHHGSAISKSLINQKSTINMLGLVGLDVAPWPHISFNTSLMLSFDNSKIEFYMNGTTLSDFNCSDNSIRQFLARIGEGSMKQTIFNTFASIEFLYKNQYSDQHVCPYIFSNAKLSWIYIYSQVDAILVKNLWKFKIIGNANETTINSSIIGLSVGGYGFSLDESLAHPLVFEHVQTMSILSSIESIKAGLFLNFNKTKAIFLQLDNLRNFFHKIGIEWTLSLPMTNQPRIYFGNIVEQTGYWIDGSEYTYPDMDLCLFAQYPQQNSIIYILNSFNLTECTCTIRWLMFNYFTEIDSSEIRNAYPAVDSIFNICESSLNEKDECEQMASRCNITSEVDGATIYAEEYQVEFIFEFMQDLFIFIVMPFASVMGLGLNILVVRAVYQNKEKELKDDFYSYMSLNAVFNCLYCSIFLLYPINSCVNTLSDLCSSIRAPTVIQLYKIIFVAFLGETFKMCGNISYILMNVNRYMLIGREHNPILEKISKWDFKWVIGVSIGLSGLINVGHIFQYSLNNGQEYVVSSGDVYVYLNTFYPLIDQTSPSLFIFLILYFFVNYLAFFVVNTVVEVTLVKKLHSELKDKQKRLDGMNKLSAAGSSGANLVPVSFRKLRKQEIEEKTEQRAIIMVVINALLNFFFRLPELFFLFSISNSLISDDNILSNFFLVFPSLKICTTDLAYFTYILTFSTNFIVYYVFNQKFKQTFSEWRNFKKRN